MSGSGYNVANKAALSVGRRCAGSKVEWSSNFSLFRAALDTLKLGLQRAHQNTATTTTPNERSCSKQRRQRRHHPPLGIELAGFHKPPGRERRITGIRQPASRR